MMLYGLKMIMMLKHVVLLTFSLKVQKFYILPTKYL